MSEKKILKPQNESNQPQPSAHAHHRVVTAKNGILWLTQAMKIFNKKPLLWLGSIFVFLISLLILLSIPLLNAISFVIMPIFLGGFMLGCQQLNANNNIEFTSLLARLKPRLTQLGVVGLIYLITIIFSSLLTLQIIDYFDHTIYTSSLQRLLKNPEEANRYLKSLIFPMLVMLTFLIPIYMGLWFAPALVLLRNQPALSAIKKSLLACAANTVPFLMFGLASLTGIIVFTIPLALIASLLPAFNLIFFILYNLVLSGLLIASQFTSFEDVFPRTDDNSNSTLDNDSLTL